MNVFEGYPEIRESEHRWELRTKAAIGRYPTRLEAEKAAEMWLDLKYRAESGRTWVDDFTDALRETLEGRPACL